MKHIKGIATLLLAMSILTVVSIVPALACGTFNSPFSVFFAKEFERIAPEYSFELITHFQYCESRVTVANIEQAIAEGNDAIFINPMDLWAILPSLEKAKEAGLVVGIFSSELPPEYRHLRDFWVGSDDFEGGKQAGEFVVAAFPNGANFVEVGGLDGHDAQIQRAAGFREAITGSNIVELGSQNVSTGWHAHEAMAIMEEFIATHGAQIDIVFCHWDNGATGVIEALHAAGMYDIRVIGIDGNSAGYQQVKDGRQWLSVGQSFANTAIKALENATIILEGGTVAEDVHTIPWDMITLETIDGFPWPEW